MKILVTNDDGITAKGINVLWQELSQIAQVAVVAPDIEKSATSQAITVHEPIRVDTYEINTTVKAWRVVGTPTDCVKIALDALLEEPPDIIVSGINHGANLATDVLYSGTVSAAIEGAIYNIPSVAVSLAVAKEKNFLTAARFVRSFVQVMQKNKLPPNTLININVPDIPECQVAGVQVTRLGARYYANTFERREDPRGRSYYWMGGEAIDEKNSDVNIDVNAVKKQYISVTPIHFDLTNYKIMSIIDSWQLNNLKL